MLDQLPLWFVDAPGLKFSRLKANTVHFTILMAAAKSIRVVGCGARGRSL